MYQFIKAALWCWVLFVTPALLSAQECGTIPTTEQLEHLTQTREKRQQFDARAMAEDRSGGSLHWIPVQFHEFVATNTTYPTVFDSDIAAWMGDLNNRFLPYGIQFFECNTRDTFVNPVLYNFDITEEPQLAQYEVAGVINVYLMSTVTANGSSLGGYSYLPPSADRIVLSKASGNVSDNKVFLHEIGHYLGLYHTHGKTNTGTTDELVNGTNCLVAGDDVCDTPADPNVLYNGGCVYSLGGFDANGHPYNPDMGNHMSYANKLCRNHFSVGQMNRMAYTALHDRNYLGGCAHPSSCDVPITTLPVVFDFENGLDGWITKSYEGFEFIPFLHGTGPTPTTATGPDAAFSGNGYVYMEASNAGPYGAYAVLISPCIDLRGVESPKVTFHYHSYGADVYETAAQISIDGGHTYTGPQSFNTLFYETGDQGNGWKTVTCDLSAYKTVPALQIRLVVSTYGELGDIAFDSIAVYNDPGSTCNLSYTTETYNITCHGANDGQLSINGYGNNVSSFTYNWSTGATSAIITNLGPGMYTVTVTANNGCSVVAAIPMLSPNYLYGTTTQTNVAVAGQLTGAATVLAMGGTLPYSYQWTTGATTAGITGLAAGVYTVTVTDQNGCTFIKTVQITQPTVVVNCASYQWTFPWASSVDNALGIFTQVSNSIDHFNWTRQSGATPTANTGPNAAYHGSHYWYTKASGGNAPNKSAMLKTMHCLRLNQLNNPVFEFYYHMYGNQMGSLSVQVSTDNEVTWTTIWTISGNQGNQWQKATVNLLPHRTDFTRLRIVGITGTGVASDMAIDALYIGEAGTNQFIPSDEMVEAPGMAVFPNPSASMFTLQMDETEWCEQIDVYNPTGQLIFTQNTYAQLVTIDLSGQTPGTYYLRVRNGEQIRMVRLLLAGN